MKIKILSFFLILFALASFKLQAQNNPGENHTVSGRIVDESTKEPLIGASVSYETGKGVTTDTSGYFSLSLPNGHYTLKVSYAGYTAVSRKLSLDGKNRTIENIMLPNNNSLDEVEIAADIAKTRETPIAFSDINAQQISQELGANDITMLLNTTPGAYASQQGGGAGDSRVNIRGFDQRNVAVMVDGVPVNDMENGQVYWSNWAGLSEITKKMQVQRGLGASRLALPSVGGVINILTNTVEQEHFVVLKNDMGTANYHRIGIGYNSGLIKNKFGVVMAASYTGGDGYIAQTWQKTWSYFAKVSYKINTRSHLVFGFNGAPQIHAQRSYAINMAFHDRTFAMKQGINADSIYALTSSNSMNKYTNANAGARGITYSPDWGYVNGKPVNAKVNYFHKPLANLTYFLSINSRTSFSNILYASYGTGGGTTLSTFPQYDKNGTGQLSMQSLFDANKSTPTGTLVPGQRPSSYFIYSKINNHKWIGTLSTLTHKPIKNLELMAGLDARYYIGTHYATPYNLLGGDYVLSNLDKNSNPSQNNPEGIKHIGDKINYYYNSKITWLGLFGQAEYKGEKMTAFLTATGNQTSFQIINYFAKRDIVLSKNNIVRNAVGYGDTLYTDGTNTAVKNYGTPVTRNGDGTITFVNSLNNQKVTMGQNRTAYNNNSSQARANTSPVKTYYGYTVKGGVNYKIDYNENLFVNVGHMNLTPRFANVYDQSGAQVYNVTNQLIYTGEIGYSVRSSKLAMTLNGYMTNWGNRPSDFALTTTKVDPVTQTPYYYNVSGMDALLKGIEFDLTYKPIKAIELRGFGMFADWRWNSQGKTYVFGEDGSKVDSVVFNAKGVHIGNAPQRQLGGSVRFELFKGFYLKTQYIYFDKMYAQFDPTKLAVDPVSKKDYSQMDSWRMPAFGLVDLFVGYTLRSGKTIVTLVASMNNVLNKVYMTDASFTTTPDNYNALNSTGWMGLGRRVNVSVKLTFK